MISGIVCDAQTVTIHIDDLAPLEAAYGTSRNDSLDACGDTDNGFGLLLNWNLVGAGVHEIVARADGVEFARVTVVVTTLGLGEFPRGLEKEVTLEDLLPGGADVVLEWVEAVQNFQIAKIIPEGVEAANCGTRAGEFVDRDGNMAALTLENQCDTVTGEEAPEEAVGSNTGELVVFPLPAALRLPEGVWAQEGPGELFYLCGSDLSFAPGGAVVLLDALTGEAFSCQDVETARVIVQFSPGFNLTENPPDLIYNGLPVELATTTIPPPPTPPRPPPPPPLPPLPTPPPPPLQPTPPPPPSVNCCVLTNR